MLIYNMYVYVNMYLNFIYAMGLGPCTPVSQLSRANQFR